MADICLLTRLASKYRARLLLRLVSALLLAHDMIGRYTQLPGYLYLHVIHGLLVLIMWMHSVSCTVNGHQKRELLVCS
jgi:hypothetical protein